MGTQNIRSTHLLSQGFKRCQNALTRRGGVVPSYTLCKKFHRLLEGSFVSDYQPLIKQHEILTFDWSSKVITT